MPHGFDGKKYERASTHQKEWRSKLIAQLDLKGTESILDLGCGDGILTSKIVELISEGYVLGVDASQGMIDAALPRERGNLHFRKLEINDLNFENEFAVVFSNATLHWVTDHQRLLQNVRNALQRTSRGHAAEPQCSVNCRSHPHHWGPTTQGILCDIAVSEIGWSYLDDTSITSVTSAR